eukprot:TRINITY_DN1914_c5_g1_i1.p1 TRINITY_DN1914_c5_g1~~TRINITY_DN1914_c5_g1_i1.p1  ORF type:complete len:387 (+),score=70.19 TRINITY_DN1914_c5_g1_i1:54-1163(+)
MPAKREQAKHAAKKRDQDRDKKQDAKQRERKVVKAIEKEVKERAAPAAKIDWDKGKIVPDWAKAAMKSSGQSSTKPAPTVSGGGARTKAPFLCLKEFCKSKNWIASVVPTKGGENGFKHLVTISSNDKLKPILNSQMEDSGPDDDENLARKDKFKYTFRNNGKGHSTQDFSMQMACLYALMRLNYKQIDSIDPKYKEQRRKIMERSAETAPELDVSGLEYGPLVDSKLVTSTRALACIKFGQFSTYESAVDDDMVEFYMYSLGAWDLTCLKQGDYFPVSVWVNQRATREEYPYLQDGQRYRGVVSAWKDTFGFIAVSRHRDVYFNVASSRFPPSAKQNVSSFFAPDQVVEFTARSNGGKSAAGDVVILS